MFTDIDECSQKHNEYKGNNYADLPSLMLIKLWLLSRSNWQAVSLYLK